MERGEGGDEDADEEGVEVRRERWVMILTLIGLCVTIFIIVLEALGWI